MTIDPKSETPRTDYEIKEVELNTESGIWENVKVIDADFARTLERELAAAKRDAENGWKLAKDLAFNLENAQGTINHLMGYAGGTDGFDEYEETIKNANAAIATREGVDKYSGK